MLRNSDIYKYQFQSLFNLVETQIGRTPIINENDDISEMPDKSRLLFDVGGLDFNIFKVYEGEYRYWVEIYILKIIESILYRNNIWFEDHYYGDCNEQYSIKVSYDRKLVEAFFLFDIVTEEPNRTEYDQLAKVLKNKVDNVDEINIFIFRDEISLLANSVNSNKDMNDNGFLKIYPLKEFFRIFFGEKEYDEFEMYANEFYEKCNSIISYKTVIVPTKKTLKAYKKKKEKMFVQTDYEDIKNKGLSGDISINDFKTVYKHFIEDKAYQIMLGHNDFADSFISAEWSYDVYKNAMGELELTGIISGYLKSIEQLLYSITKLHIGEGIKIRTMNDGYQYYSKSNEEIIDSTLGSLNEFVTSKHAKLAINAKVRDCINKAIQLWTKYQRNGYFHKHNLYSSDNKINEVRELTLYLYFLILGGIDLSEKQKEKLGINDYENDHHNIELSIDETLEKIVDWLKKIKEYDLKQESFGLWILISLFDNQIILDAMPLQNFDINCYKSDDAFIKFVDLKHTSKIPKIIFNTKLNDEKDAVNQIEKIINLIRKDNIDLCSNIGNIVISYGKTILLVNKKSEV